jgi:hypothetical protein
MKRIVYIGIAIIAISTIIVCATVLVRYVGKLNDESRFGLFGEGDTKLPCWWEVCLGTTYTRAEITQYINADSRISLFSVDPETNTASFLLVSKDSTRRVWVDLPSRGGLYYVRIRPYGGYIITLEDIINKYGEPDYIGFSELQSNEDMIILYYKELNTYFITEGVAYETDCFELSRTALISSITIDRNNWTIGYESRFIHWDKWNGIGKYRIR